MATNSTGTKNQPYIDVNQAPDLGVDENNLADYAALVGNRKAGTNSDRLALTGKTLWAGLEFHETDTGSTFVYRGSAGWRQLPTGQFFAFERQSGDERNSTTTGQFTPIAQASYLGAPAGVYLIGCNFVTSGSTAANALMRLTAGSTNVSNDFRADLTTQAFNGSFSHPFVWTGGDLPISLFMNAGNGTGFVYTIGTGVWAIYLGPAA